VEFFRNKLKKDFGIIFNPIHPLVEVVAYRSGEKGLDLDKIIDKKECKKKCFAALNDLINLK
jgi:hypothetical protein